MTTIRHATRDDGQAIDRFAEVTIHDTYDSLVDERYAADMLAMWWGSALDDAIGEGSVHVAIDIDEVVGLAQTGEWEGEPVLWKLYVAPGRRGQGLGRRLLDAVVADLPTGTARLRTEQIAANTRAARFYEREGFGLERVEPADDQRVSIVWRSKPLAMTIGDPYAVTAPYYDLLAESFWTTLGPALSAVLSDVDPSAGPIVDIGAGTGRSTFVITEAVPSGEVWAVEPSPSMRAILLAHVALRPDLYRRVTVLDSDIAGLSWPDSVAAVVACNMVGHLDPETRLGLWRTAAAHLAPDGVAIVGLQPPSRPERLERTETGTVDVGRNRYVGDAAAEPTGERSVRWTMHYRTIRDGTVVEHLVKQSDWWTVSADDVRAEAGSVGLTMHEAAEGLLVLTHQPGVR